MPKPKYSLDALERLRDARVDEAKKALGDAVRAREAAAARRAAAEQRLELRRREIEAVKEAERAALERGGAAARDLALEDAWALAAGAELEQLARDAGARRAEEESAVVAEAEARARAALRQADADVVHEDHERFDASRRKEALEKEAEAAEEAWRRRG